MINILKLKKMEDGDEEANYAVNDGMTPEQRKAELDKIKQENGGGK